MIPGAREYQLSRCAGRESDGPVYSVTAVCLIVVEVIQLIDLIGEEKATDILQNKVAESNRLPAYDNTQENILSYWLDLFLFIFAFAALATITLEFIDKDKR